MLKLSNADLRLLAVYTAECLEPKIKQFVEDAINNKDRILNIKEVANLLDLKTDAVRMRCRRGRLPYHKKDSHYYFSYNEIISFLLTERKSKPIHYTDDPL